MHAVGAPVFAAVVLWVLVANVAMKEMSPGRKLPPGHCVDCISRHNPQSFCEGLLAVQELQAEGWASGMAHI